MNYGAILWWGECYCFHLNYHFLNFKFCLKITDTADRLAFLTLQGLGCGKRNLASFLRFNVYYFVSMTWHDFVKCNFLFLLSNITTYFKSRLYSKDSRWAAAKWSSANTLVCMSESRECWDPAEWDGAFLSKGLALGAASWSSPLTAGRLRSPTAVLPMWDPQLFK